MKTKLSITTALFFFLLAFFFSAEKKERHTRLSPKYFESEERHLAANDALEFWMRSRAYPNNDIPDIGYADALDFSRLHLRKNSPQKFSTDVWKSIGPKNFGGRTISIALNPINPSTIYAGSASGGLWRTYTKGEGITAWNYVPVKNSAGNYYPVLGVGAIAIDPTDTNTILIGTGEVYGYQKALGGFGWRTTRGSYGIGILKTTNGGTSWTHPLNWSRNQRRGVQDVAFHPFNSNIVYAATTEGTYKSTNKGSSWSIIHDVVMATDIAINPLYPETLFVSCGNLGSPNSGVYRSYDGGETFSRLNGLPNFSGKTLLSFYNTSPNVVYADVADSVSGKGLFRSINNGDSWVQVNSQNYASYQGWFSHLVVVNQADTSKILCAGVDVFKSQNGGRTLTKKSDWSAWYFGVVPTGEPEGPSDYSHADHHAFAIHPQFPNTVYFGNDGGVFVTMDFGETFAGRNGGYHSQQFYNGSANSYTDSLFASGGMQDNATAFYIGREDGAWNRVVGGDGCWTAIDAKNDSIVYGSAQYLAIYRSYEHSFGEWSYVYGGIGSFANFVAPYIVPPMWSDDSTGYSKVIIAGEDVISKSTDEGANWTPFPADSLDGNAVLSLAVSTYKADTIFAGTLPTIRRAGLFKTENGGTLWKKITRWIAQDSPRVYAELPNRYPMDIALDENNPQRAFVVFGGYDTSHVYRTTNSGTSWIDCDSGALPNVPTNAVVIDPNFPDNIYIGNDIGVYLSTDGGNSWNEFLDGMPPAIVMDVSVSRSNRTLRAFTHGLGAWERKMPDGVVGVADEQTMPIAFSLQQNYPNPFNPQTTIGFSLLAIGNVTLKIFDVLGREVATLIDNETIHAGNYEKKWNAENLPSGIYFSSLTVNNFTQTKKMLLLK
mgnify:CR=1 FL=1